MTDAADLSTETLTAQFPPGWFTAEEFRRRHNPRWPPVALRHALRQMAEEGRLETRIDGSVREYRAVK